MNPAYQHLALAAAKPGMVLSDELLDKQGQVLLPKGAVLTERIIALLPSHDIDMVAVVCEAAPAAPVDTGAVSARLDQLFRKHDPDNPDEWATGALRHYMNDFRLDREIAP